MMKYLQSEAGLDIGDPATRARLQGMVGPTDITQLEVDAVLGLALVPDPVSRLDIEAALFETDGREIV